MAHRTEFAWIGSLNDPAYGIDDVGEMFYTIADAEAALLSRHRDSTEMHPLFRPTGDYRQEPFGVLTDEAFILLWQLDEDDRLTDNALSTRTYLDQQPLDVRSYMAPRATHVVWIGARQAVRRGSIEQFEEQQARRKRQDVREAGSVVVTDA